MTGITIICFLPSTSGGNDGQPALTEHLPKQELHLACEAPRSLPRPHSKDIISLFHSWETEAQRLHDLLKVAAQAVSPASNSGRCDSIGPRNAPATVTNLSLPSEVAETQKSLTVNIPPVGAAPRFLGAGQMGPPRQELRTLVTLHIPLRQDSPALPTPLSG